MSPSMNAVKAADAIADAMTTCRLAKSDWTHGAHVQAGLSLVLRHGAKNALQILREAIPRYNNSTNTPNTDSGGYHDTLTVYYVWAIDELLRQGVAPEDIVSHELVSRTAALRFWTRDELFSVEARRHWMTPTLTADGTRIPRQP